MFSLNKEKTKVIFKKLSTLFPIFLLTAIFVCLNSFAAQTDPLQPENLLKNSSFELGMEKGIPKYWGTEYYNATLVSPGKVGKYAVKIQNIEEKMSVGAQKVSLPYEKYKKIVLSGYVKLENIVQGPEDWNKVNIQVLFLDANGNQLGGYPSLGPWSGTMEWMRFVRSFHVPKGTRFAKVVFGLYNCKGTAYFDDIKITSVVPQAEVDPYNLLANGDFDIWESWAYGGSDSWGIVYPAKHGVGALWIKNDLPIWSFASQTVPIDGKKVKKIDISAYVKAKNVVMGKKPWQVARVNIEFKDGKGKRIGGWPIVANFDGTFDWKKIENSFQVPENTKRADVYCGLLECSGEAWFDWVRFEGYDKSGKRVKRGGVFKTQTKNWYKFYQPKKIPSESIIDVSYLLDPPAGKHGFLKVRNGHFYFEDGTRARFWGTNVYAPYAFPEKKEAEKMAIRLARAGCNLVRLHHLDAFWADPNIFDETFNDTQHFSKESLDKLDYFIYQLKLRGIYVFLDLLVDREFKEGDNIEDYNNVERGAKFSGFYDRKIINLQKRYAYDILTHYNPYTKLRYVDDPVIVSAKLINEAMLFYIGTQFGLSSYYMKELDDLWNVWLMEKYGSRENLVKAWTDKYGKCDLKGSEDPRLGNVERGETPLSYQRGGVGKVEPLRVMDTMKFYYDLQVKYFIEMEEYLKSIGLKVPVSGSNHWVNIVADVKSNAELDYIDRHRYWDHPQLSYGTQVIFENQAMVKNPEDALPNNFAYYKVKGVPFVVSEWNCCFPNEYRVEGPLILAAYANLHDWDGVLQFSFNHSGFVAPIEDNFDISSWPNVWAQWPAAAIIFYRNDVKKAKYVIEQVLGDKELFGPIYEDRPISDEPMLPLITRTEISFAKDGRAPKFDFFLNKFHDPKNKIISSDTNEIIWDYGKGIFKVDTEKTQGAVGFLGNNSVKLSSISIFANTPFCSIIASSMDDLPISKSRQIMISVGSRVENKGQVYNEIKTQLIEVGTSPLFVEGVNGKVLFNRTPKLAFALDINGNRLKKAEIITNGIKMGSADKAFFYEVIF